MTQIPPTVLPLEDANAPIPLWKKTLHYSCDHCCLMRAIYLRALAVIYLIAFISLWTQIDGLIGAHGILPVGDYLGQFRDYGVQRFHLIPTLCWLNSSNAFLHFLCGGGVVMSLLLIAGFAPIPLLILLWIFYLSLTQVGQVFLSFQWDELLLEAGFLAIFFAPWTLRPRLSNSPGPSPLILFLHRWLIFRLMFESGIVKITGGDANWMHLHAMQYHYWTQPLPPWTAWYMAQLPVWFGQASVVVVFIAELLIPLFYFWPRSLRIIGFWATVVFQLLILATGNYGFFNVLAIVLCIPLTDDRFWQTFWRRLAGRWMRKKHPPQIEMPAAAPSRAWRWPLVITTPVTIFLLLFTTVAGLLRCGLKPPYRLQSDYGAIATFGIANGYGLFEMMTTTRPEIIIEGSDDGVLWKPYQFKLKIGDVTRRPRFCTPHMPRLDWQMWFAALYADQGEINPWIISFATKLLQGDKTVLALMGNNSFPDHPPKYVRLMLYDYRFTTFATAKPASPGGASPWWTRKKVGPLTRPLELDAEGNLEFTDSP